MILSLGSLFDGIGGFPLAASRCGIKPVWSSEIDKSCLKVTAHHFPDMAQLGDIRYLNGGEISPVDILTGGSPCQDLSVAGKGAGLKGERSGLFREMIRVIGEMRDNSGKPQYVLWENVPGAFSSNKGQDFKAVLEGFLGYEVPMPRKWTSAGMVGGCLAWRVLDAQYFGVPQRRRRIFLVRDFGGRRAGEILFEPAGMSGDTPEGGKAWEGVARPVTGGTGRWRGVENDTFVVRTFPNDQHRSNPSKMAFTLEPGNNQAVARCQTAGEGNRLDGESCNFIFQQAGSCDILQSNKAYPLCGTYSHPNMVMSVDSRNGNESDVSTTIQAGGKGHGPAPNHGYIVRQNMAVRRLTPTECERLMGLPDGWTDLGISDSARYRMLGNSVAVPVVEWIMRRIAGLMT